MRWRRGGDAVESADDGAEAAGQEGFRAGVAEEEPGGAETGGEGDVVGADAIVEQDVDSLLEVVDAIGDDAAEGVASLFDGKAKGGVGIAPVVEGLALVIEFIHDRGDRFTLAQGFESALLVGRKLVCGELEQIRAG